MELKQFFFKTLIVISTVAALYALFEIRSILLLFFGALLFASTVRPLVTLLNSRKIPPLLSILVIYLIFLGGLVAVVVILFPTFALNVQDLLQSQNTILQGIASVLERVRTFAAGSTGLSLPVPRVSEMQTYITQFQAQIQQNVQQLILSSVEILSEVFILFILSFYWLTERDHLEEWGLQMVSHVHRERVRLLINELENTLGAFVRGQTVLCLVVFVLSFAALSLLGVRSALVLAVFAGVAEAIPMIGPIIGAVPAILVALIASPEQALFVAIAFVVIQQLESQLLVPKIMERQVGLPPMLVLLALTAGNLLGGLVGAVIAIPIAATLKILVREFIITPTMEARKFPQVGDAILLTDAQELATAAATTAPAAPTPASSAEPTPATTPILVSK